MAVLAIWIVSQSERTGSTRSYSLTRTPEGGIGVRGKGPGESRGRSAGPDEWLISMKLHAVFKRDG